MTDVYYMAVSHKDWQFDWLRSILKVVLIFPSRPVTVCGEKHFKLKCKSIDYLLLKIFIYGSAKKRDEEKKV